ncbi:hypothetical protein CEXT_559681 [Caerostris extrusa]|uniref:Uncharacterized protein n=1 Tax=Caerostris extrusa TaxID=172846 RepID=A0AAV4TPI4_CAEEX|nr:hypothetical protein CEXT_559681 [Caerostris extrusa]
MGFVLSPFRRLGEILKVNLKGYSASRSSEFRATRRQFPHARNKQDKTMEIETAIISQRYFPHDRRCDKYRSSAASSESEVPDGCADVTIVEDDLFSLERLG